MFFKSRSNPRISILLPTHNRADVLPLAIRSVLNQTIADFELLIVGDGCTDHTAQVVKSFKDARIKWFDLPKAPNYGCANRDKVMQHARGELIAYQAHDDLWLPDHLERLTPCFDNPRMDLAYSRPLWVEPDGTLAPMAFNLLDPGVLEEFTSGRKNMIPAACFMYRKECHKRAGGWDNQRESAEDWALWIRIIKSRKEVNFTYLPEPTCLHFRANWRQEENAGPAELRAWRQRLHSAWPLRHALTVPVSGHPNEQSAFWKQIQKGGAAWVKTIRETIQQALDRVVWEQDQGYLPLLDHVWQRDREIDHLRKELQKTTRRKSAPRSPASFGEGFYPEDGGARWMSREGTLMVSAETLPSEITLTLECEQPGYYTTFPLTVSTRVNGEAANRIRFEKTRRSKKLTLKLWRPANIVNLKSDGYFRPDQVGLNKDQRELSVRVRTV